MKNKKNTRGVLQQRAPHLVAKWEEGERKSERARRSFCGRKLGRGRSAGADGNRLDDDLDAAARSGHVEHSALHALSDALTGAALVVSVAAGARRARGLRCCRCGCVRSGWATCFVVHD